MELWARSVSKNTGRDQAQGIPAASESKKNLSASKNRARISSKYGKRSDTTLTDVKVTIGENYFEFQVK